ncbi:MAG: penicillin-binding transpeptidase domain-containing protein, partial [Acidobacteriota bacterium]
MKLMCPTTRLATLFFAFLLTLALTAGATAQIKKKALPVKKPVAKKTIAKGKDAKKDSRKPTKKEELAKKNSKTGRDKASAKTKGTKKDTRNAKASSRDKDTKGSKKSRVELRREAAERKAAEAVRLAAALAEKRRREQAAREARERKLAFERGLRNETAANIANDNTDGEDPTIRAAAVNALGNHAGTVVVMEAQTGKVLTIVNQDWAIRNSFKPCSTIKLVTGVGGLNEHVIEEGGTIRNSSGSMKLQDALAFSNNGYFQRVGVNIGSSKMVEYAKELGLGERTGINADGETPGRIPNGNNNPRIYSHGDDFEVTPLQLAVLVSALSNGGKKMVPQIPGPRIERSSFRPQVSGRIEVPKSVAEGMLPGMIGAAEYGTARRGVDASMGVAGKTGSCIAKGSWVGLFASVAPVEDPKYSVVVITRGESERGKYAAAIAGKVYNALSSRIQRNPDKDLARRLRLEKSSVDARTAAKMDEDEDDADSPDR